MAEDKNKKGDELGKNELGEISGGINFGGLIKKPPFPKAPFHVAKYACPPKPEKKDEEINNELNPLPDNNEQGSNK